MEVTIDKYGRIVIPKPVRDALGLNAGTTLHLEMTDDAEGREISLRPEHEEPVLQRKGGVLVHTGTADEPIDPVAAVRRSREERTRKLAGGMDIVSDR